MTVDNIDIPISRIAVNNLPELHNPVNILLVFRPRPEPPGVSSRFQPGTVRQYQAEAKRKEEQRGSLNLDDYLSRLEIRADIHRMKPDELSRTAQLCGKTNQFNLTTKRYTEAELLELSQDPLYTIYTVHAADKYGENGLISVVILKQKDETAEFDTFLMSCRVMGRKLEDVILNEIAADQCGSKKELIGCYIPTAKNKPVSDLYDRLGFELSGTDGGTKYYHLDLRNYQRKEIDAYASIQFES